MGIQQENLSILSGRLVRRRFTHLKALNGVQSIACFLWAATLVALPFQRPQKGAKIAPWLAYWKPGISNSIGPALGTQALRNISYPAQVTCNLSAAAQITGQLPSSSPL